MEKGKSKTLIWVLIAVIVVLAGLVLYMLVIRPAITGNVVRLQNDGVQYAVYTIMQQATSCQPVLLTFGNQTINMIAIGCPGTEQIAAAMQQQA